MLACERDPEIVAQTAVDAGLRLSGAAFGVFFYTTIGDDGEEVQFYEVSGSSSLENGESRFAGTPLLRNTELLGHIFNGQGSVRVTDLLQDATYAEGIGREEAVSRYGVMRSFLGVPVMSRTGQALGSLLFGHSSVGVFSEDAESDIKSLAAQAAAAMENSRLAATLCWEIGVADTARAAQHDTAERLEQALDATQLGTWSWDRASDMLDLDARAAAIFYAAPHVPVRRSDLRKRMVSPEDLNIPAEELRRSLENGGFYKAEYRVRNPERPEEYRWIATRGKGTYHAGSAEITGMIGTAQDITDRKMQEATLRQSEKLAATGRLAATIAHEINNPLEAATNLIYLAKIDPLVPASIHKMLDTADAEIARVSAIAQQTLGFYRDTSRPAEVDINALLEGVVGLFSRKLGYKKLSCSLDLVPDLRVFGLQGELRQVFSNLLVNAIDASMTGAIHIRGRHCRRPECRGVAVLIVDSGSGIPAELRRSLFSPFFTTKQTLGTGLGLWVTRGILEKMGGTISFRTRTEPPTGSCFRIFLPAEVANPQIFSSPQSNLIQ